MVDHDVNMTINFAPLSNIQVNFMDKDSGKPLLISILPTAWATTNSIDYENGDPAAPSASKFEIRAIKIPGYKLVSNPIVDGLVGQVQTKDDSNPIMINFDYEKVDKSATDNEINPDGKPQIIGINWSSMPGAFNVTGVYGEKIKDENGDVTGKVQALADKYAKQGFAYIGSVGGGKNDDYFNYREAGVWLHFIPNQSVTVKYVDEKGNSLLPSTIMSTNVNNENQANDGIDHQNHWYPAGNWVAKPKEITNYTVDSSKSSKITAGEYQPFNQTVTFVYSHNQGQVVVNYIDQDDNNKIIKNDVIKGDLGSKTTYTTTDEIQELEKQGFELVHDGYPKAGETITTNTPTYTVTLKHKTKEVTPNNPGQPGKPVDPTNPTGPKYPAGTDVNSLRKVINQTINYVDENGNELHTPVTDSVTFERTGTFDEVTGKVTYTNWNADKAAFSEKDSPVINGYYLKDKRQAKIASKTVSVTSSDDNETVVYAKMGSLIPVDPNGNEIPGVDHPQYPNDPKDPSKPVNPVIPNIPGMTPLDPTTNQPLQPGDQYPIDPSHPGDNTLIKYIVNKPNTPNQPVEPAKPTTPNNPVKPVVPTKPAVTTKQTTLKNNATTVAKKQTVANNSHKANTPVKKATLPQTGEVEQNSKSLLGAILVAFTGIIGMIGLGKKDQKD